MLSPPLLKFGRAGAPAAIAMLVGSNSSNYNCRFLRSMGANSREALFSPLSSAAGSPSPHPKPPPAVQTASPRRVLCPIRAASSGSPAGLVAGQNPSDPPLVVVSFYRFADFPDHADLRKPLKDLCAELVKQMKDGFHINQTKYTHEILKKFNMDKAKPIKTPMGTSTKLDADPHGKPVDATIFRGGIILAPEGINGSICGSRESVEKVLQFIQTDNRLKGLRMVESPVSPEEEAIHHGHTSHSPLGAGEDAPFRWDHVRVKIKKEIVSFGDPSVSPIKKVGTYVNPKDWNALIRDPETMVIDVRNTYETRIGKFKGAVDPYTTAFREFPAWVDDQFQLWESNGQHLVQEFDGIDVLKETTGLKDAKRLPRVAMYCTGGIRCEKASSFLLSKGFKEVYHLEGGILKYLEEIPKTESLWEGECFVFDKRVSVEHGLVQGSFKLCYGCKQPVSDEDMESPEWEYGVSCPYCFASKSAEEKERARARQRQFETWGVVGGPDKGRRNPARSNGGERKIEQLPNSI